MTTSSKKSGGVDFNLRPLDDRLLFCSTSAPYGTHAQQQNPPKAGTFGYVTNRFDNSISVIDTAKNAVVGTIPVGGGPFGVAITPDGAHAYVANQLENTVSVIDAAENTVVATIPVGAFPTGVAVTSDGARPPEANDSRRKSSAYVTNTFDDTVSVVDTASNKVVATIPVGTSPFAVAFATVTPSHRSSEQEIIRDARWTQRRRATGFSPQPLTQNTAPYWLSMRTSARPSHRWARLPMQGKSPNRSRTRERNQEQPISNWPGWSNRVCGSREPYGGRRKGL